MRIVVIRFALFHILSRLCLTTDTDIYTGQQVKINQLITWLI